MDSDMRLDEPKRHFAIAEVIRQRDNLRALVDALGFTNTNDLMMGTRTQAIIAGAAEKGLAVDAIRRLNER